MGSYGNGFRGIGASYGENKNVGNQNCRILGVYRRSLLAAGCPWEREQRHGS